MATLPECSVDAIVTDPPYELGFMGKGWDSTGVANDVETWRQCLRVLKPGGHLLAFGGTRTYHRMAVAIEDAGFEIRDQIGWLYGSGFPKSLDVSKAIDKHLGAKREVVGSMPDRWTGKGNTLNFSTDRPQAEVAVTGEAVTGEAVTWEGWGTALKPAWEPVCMARKPLVGTVAANVLEHGAGALNIDGCRVGYAGTEDAAAAAAAAEIRGRQTRRNFEGWGMGAQQIDRAAYLAGPAGAGRWPANIIHDGSDEVVAAFPAEAGASAPVRGTEPSTPAKNVYGTFKRGGGAFHADTGSAARFFYCAKADRADRNEGLQGMEARQQDQGRKAGNPGGDNPRNRGVHARENHHPTVKPTDLMRYLCRLVTPPGGVVLDPFMGSGSTLKAAELEGFSAIGIELSPEYIAIAQRRIAADAPLFASVEVA